MSRNQGTLLSQTIGKSSGLVDKTIVGLFRWASTDHTGLTQALEHIPEMGFLDELKHIFILFLITMIGAVFGGIWVYVLVAYGIPLFLDWLL